MSNKRPRIGILGGAFNPLHNEHIQLAYAAINALEIDHVFLVPSMGNEGFKDLTKSPSPELRASMCENVTRDMPKMSVSRFEIERGKPTPTHVTLEYFASQKPEANLYLIIGADQACSLEQWRNPMSIGTRAEIVVGSRGDVANSDIRSSVVRATTKAPYLVEVSGGTSSTEIRNRIQRHEDVSDLVPDEVAQIIERYNLYIATGSAFKLEQNSSPTLS